MDDQIDSLLTFTFEICTNCSLGVLHWEKDEWDKVVKYFERAYDIRCKRLGQVASIALTYVYPEYL